MFFILVAASLSVLAKGYVLPSVFDLDAERIVGGTPANILDAPYQVALLYGTTGDFFDQRCGGALIKQKAVLTSVYCVRRTTPSNWMIRAGATFHSHNGMLMSVSRLTAHSLFTEEGDNDVAVVFPSSDLPILNEIRLVALPLQNHTIEDGTPTLVTGWGSLYLNGPRPEQLHKVIVPVVNQNACVETYSHVNPVTGNMICAGNMTHGGRDACSGDTGGPMVDVESGIIVGIRSWGYGCGDAGKPGVYTRVSEYREWIDERI